LRNQKIKLKQNWDITISKSLIIRKKKGKMFASFNEINLNIFVEIGRIKKP